MAKRIQTHEELYSFFLESVGDFMKSVKVKQKDLSDRNDDEERTKLHHTVRLMQAWFRSKGGLPLSD